MAYVLKLDTYSRDYVNLTVYENNQLFQIQRLFFLTNLDKESERGGNTSVNSYEGIICINGSCEVHVRKDDQNSIFKLDSPDKCLIIEPYEWHKVINFKEGSILLAFSDKKYSDVVYI